MSATRFAKYRSIRITKVLEARVIPYAERFGWSVDKFAEVAILAIIELVEHPESRTVPEVVLWLDTSRTARPALAPIATPSFGVNEDPPAAAQKKRA